MTTRNRELASIIDDSGNITAGGNLTVSGTTLTASSTVETHADPLIELNTGAGSNANDLGFVFERGSTGDNACIIWDESNDAFAVGTTTATGTSTGNMSYTVGDFLAGKVTVDSVLINGTTIGHTSDTDLITLADGLVTVAGEISVTTLDIGGTNVSATAAELNILDGVNSTAAELNILDGVTATAAEINIIDGDTSATGTTLADADRVIVNDGGTMKQVALTDFETYFESAIDTFSTIDINGGSIDGATVGAASASTGAFTTLSATKASSGASATSGTVLTVEDDDNTELSILGGSSSLLAINFGHSGDNDEGKITFNTTAGSEDLQIVSSKEITLDATGDIILDADGGDITFKDGGSSIGRFKNNSGNFVIKSEGSNDDLKFLGNDDGSEITAMTIDMSEGGKVGIGTTSPAGILHVDEGAADDARIIAETHAGGDSMILFSQGASGAGTPTWGIGLDAGSGTSDGLSIGFEDTGYDDFSLTTDSKLVITTDGKVGIGTTDPTDELELKGDTYRFSVHSADQLLATLGNWGNSGADIDEGHLAMYSSGTETVRLATNADSFINGGKVIIGDTASHTTDLLQIETPASGGGHGIQIRRNDANTDQTIGHIMFGNNTATDLVKISAKTDGDSNAGDSGALLFHTQVTGGNLTQRMEIDSKGCVGIGTAATNAGFRLSQPTTSEWAMNVIHAASGGVNYGLSVDTSAGASNAVGCFQLYPPTGGLIFTNEGNLGIGTTSPTSYNSAGQQLVVVDSGNTGISIIGGTSSTSSIMFGDGTGGTAAYRGAIKYDHSNDDFAIHTEAAEVITIASGNTTFFNAYDADVSNGPFVYLSNSGSVTVGTDSTSSRNVHSFRNPNDEVGIINLNGSTCSFTSLSDYRKKENVSYTYDATSRLKQLKPCRFNWIADETNTAQDGFLAHEVSTICPEAVVGEKDGVYAETTDTVSAGDPEYQMLDATKLIPLMVKTIQEQQQQIEELKTKVAVLEG